MELPMLFYCLIWLKLGWDDAHYFSVKEIDLWILFGVSLLCHPRVNISLLTYSVITVFLIMFVLTGLMGSADRDVLLIMLLTQSFQEWLIIIFIASCFALIHALIKQKKVVPFLFFIGLGHLLNFCLKTL
jgi:hypothetical protein